MRIRAPKWLWDRRIPAGAITLFAGREGIGKSTGAASIVARVTRGTLPGRFEGTPRGVIIVATEDAWSEVILPRLVAAGADLDLVFRIDAEDKGAVETVSVPQDLAELAERCAEYGVALILCDPIMSVINERLDSHKDREVRQALEPLARFAARNTVSVTGLIHVNKSTTTDPLNSIMGSRAFAAVARSVLYAIVDPDAESEDRFLLGHVKSNLGPKQPSIGYQIDEVKLEIPDPAPGDDRFVITSRVKWGDVDERSIRDILETPRSESRVGELSNDVVEFIAEKTAAGASSVTSQEIAAAFPDVKQATLDSTLYRLTNRKLIDRIMRGHYTTVKPPPGSWPEGTIGNEAQAEHE
jgi:hypothetical protein